MATTLVFVAGCSGAGKTRLCAELSRVSGKIAHVQVSRLLSSAQLKGGVDQIRLAEKVRGIARAAGEPVALVDGHLILRGRLVSPAALGVLELAGIVLVNPDVETISRQRLADAARDRPKTSLRRLTEENRKLKALAYDVSRELGVMIREVKSSSFEDFKLAVESICSERLSP